MQDPWKYLAFPLASVAGYVVSQTALSSMLGSSIGLSTTLAEVVLVALTGLIAGFMVDEVIPAYVEKVRNRRGGGGAGGGFDEGGFGDEEPDFG